MGIEIIIKKKVATLLVKWAGRVLPCYSKMTGYFDSTTSQQLNKNLWTLDLQCVPYSLPDKLFKCYDS